MGSSFRISSYPYISPFFYCINVFELFLFYSSCIKKLKIVHLFSSMQAIILTGGFGTRLAPLTFTRPKSLLPLLNKPLIHHVIDSLPQGTDVILATNYKREAIEEYFTALGRPIIINDEPHPLGTGGAVKFADRYLQGTFLVMNGDIISSLNIRKFIKFHTEMKAAVSISLWPVENVEEFGVVDLKPNGRIMKFVEKPSRELAPSNLINAGAYILDKSIVEYIDDGFVSMERDIFPQVIFDGKRFCGYTFEGFWIDVGRPLSYLEAHWILMRRQGVDNVTGAGCDIQGRISGSCLGRNVTVGSGSRVLSSVVFDGVDIDKRSHIEECIVGEGCRIGRNVRLVQSIVGDGEVIGDNQSLKSMSVWTKPVPEGYPPGQIGNVVKE